jgi:hypothetical protein
MLKKIKAFFYNPVYIYTAVCVIQGMWLTVLGYDAFTHAWGHALIHLTALAVNSYSIHTARKTMFLSIWQAAAQYHQDHSAQSPSA